jgi:hypothetical protein
MANVQVNEAFAPFTANGTMSGVVTVADNSSFFIGAFAYLYSDTQPEQYVRIMNKPSLTQMGVLFLTPPDFLARYGQTSDASMYTVADNARISMPQQVINFRDFPQIITISGGGGSPTGPAGGDLYLTFPNPNVGGLRGRPISAAIPSVGDVYQWNGTNWIPTSSPGGPPTGPAGNALTGTYPDPGLHPLETTIFVDFNTTHPIAARKGTIAGPYKNMQEAMDHIAASSYTKFGVCVASGVDLAGFTVPTQKNITIYSDAKDICQVGDIIWTVEAPMFNPILTIRNLQVGMITANDGPSPAGNAKIICENATIGEVLKTGTSGISLIISGNQPSYSNTSTPYGANVLGNITLNVLIAKNTKFDISCSQIDVSTIFATNCAFECDISVTSTSAELNQCVWETNGNTFQFTLAPGVLRLDSQSTYSFLKKLVALVNGKLIRHSQLGVTGLTFTTPPTLEGQLYSYVSSSTVDLSDATVKVKSRNIAGVFNNDLDVLAVVSGIPFPVRFVPGLTLAEGQLFYLSKTTPGLATNVEPTTSGDLLKIGGYITDTSTYNPLDPTGSVASCILSQIPLFEIP